MLASASHLNCTRYCTAEEWGQSCRSWCFLSLRSVPPPIIYMLIYWLIFKWSSLYSFIPPKLKTIHLYEIQASHTNFFFKKSTLDPSFPHCTDAAQRLHPDKSSSAFSKPKIPVCQEHTIQICEKRKMAPCIKNSRNAIRINLFYAEVKRRRRWGWGGVGVEGVV